MCSFAKKFFIMLFLFFWSFQSSGQLQCAQMFDAASQNKATSASRSYVIDSHKKNSFVTGRGLAEYNFVFSRPGYPQLNFKTVIKSLAMNPQAHLLDVGGGEGYATEQLVTAENNFKATMISLETQAKPIYDPKTNELRRDVKSGKFIEDMVDLPRFDVWLDVYGAGAYTDKPHAVLKKLVEFAKPNAIGFYHLGDRLDNFGQYNLVVNRQGQVMPYSEWLQTLPGLKVEIVKISSFVPDTFIAGEEVARTAKIQHPADQRDVIIPELERVSYLAGDPLNRRAVPRMIFREKGADQQNFSYPRADRVQVSFETIFSHFRTGEITNIFLQELKQLKGQKWAYFGGSTMPWAEIETAVKMPNDSFFDVSHRWVGYNFKKLRAQGIVPQIHNLEQLPSDQSVQFISDLEGRFVTGHLTAALTRYLQAIRNEGSILLNLGNAETGLSKTQIIQPDGTPIFLVDWLKKIPGLTVEVNSVPKTVQTWRKKFHIDSRTDLSDLSQVPYEMIPFREVLRLTTVRIRIKDRTLVDLPSLNYLGKSAPTEEGFEVPLYQEVGHVSN